VFVRKELLAFAAAALVSACASPTQAPPGPPAAQAATADLPANYRAVVAARVRETFFDPYSIRDASISAPIAGQSFLGPVMTICVRANAKNRMGAYIGAKPTSFVFRGGQLTATDSEYAGMTCASAVYEPFPEIEVASSRPPVR
jgi:hypothetical protein